MDKPLILLTNDDGIDSPFLESLADHLMSTLDAEIMVIAPESQQSAMSQTITLHKPLRIQERRPGVFAVSGTPVDCVYIGVMKLAARRPHLVISGPNDGFNLGTDVFYSGTVGAALEGGLRGISAIAVSLGANSSAALPMASSLVAGMAAKMIAGNEWATGTVLNVNVPGSCDGRVRWTKLGRRYYEDDVHQRTDPRNRPYYWIGGGIAGIADIDGSDCEATIQDGIASITPLHLDLTAKDVLEKQQTSLTIDDFAVE